MGLWENESAEHRAARANTVVTRLRQVYPDARCSLDFSNALELLVATMLSAQCTDERVNLVTKDLFRKYRTAADYAQANPEELEDDIKPTGFYRNKAKHIREAAAILVRDHHGEVPRTMGELIALPGVARKTANVVLGNAYGVVEGVVVDTHVGRLARRMGLTATDDPVKVEQDLMAAVQRPDWLDLSHIFIFHGRALCQARKPLCEQCAVAGWCPTGVQALGIEPKEPAPLAAEARERKAK